jgi:L-cysteate sulfo-lyase
LVIGGSVCLPETKIIGIDIDAEPERVHDDVVRLGEEAAALLDLSFDKARVEVVSGHAGPAYGVPHAATWDAIALAGRLEALVLDPVYTGKALAGLIAMIGTGRWCKRDNIVFLHTGGTPAVFAYASRLPA